MRRLILLLFILITAALLAQSKTSVSLGGTDGMSLLKSMANVTSNLTETNNTTINLSHSPLSAQLSGNDGAELYVNLTNDSINSTKEGNMSDPLSTWGSKPRDPPPPPSAAAIKNAKFNKIIRDNHIA
jgi:hypothetical protein